MKEKKKHAPKFVLRKCEKCQKPVKSILYEKGKWFDEYICLENFEAEEFHIFKVETDLYHQTQIAESALGTIASGAFIYKIGKGNKGNQKPSPESDQSESTILECEGSYSASPTTNEVTPQSDSNKILEFLETIGILGDL